MAELAAKGLHFTAAMLSTPAPDEVVAQRRAECSKCPARIVERRGEFCGECGCPRTSLSELSSKLRRGKVHCPRARPGFTNAAESTS